jgi:hypothetical protein
VDDRVAASNEIQEIVLEQVGLDQLNLGRKNR